MNEWKECKLGEVAEIVGGGTPKTKKSNYWNGEIPWLTPRDLSNFNGRYISKGERNISKLGLAKSSAKILPKGAVLLSSRAPVGYLAIAKNDISTNQGFRSLIPNSETNNLFLFYLLKNNVEYLKSQSTGTTFGELAGSTLKSLSFYFPPLPEQRTIASVLSSLDDKIDLLHRQNKTLEAMAETLFRQWFVEEA
ncbi:restriction endonuclease subunit S, partial [candidate division WOR-3 bacterium]|nr:restriction endonuclease subunit S [candidate division WOR-3 bacterium]